MGWDELLAGGRVLASTMCPWPLSLGQEVAGWWKSNGLIRRGTLHIP